VGLYFEDLVEGMVYKTGRLTITEQSIIQFAFEWDPQPFHIDRLGAEASMFGGLIGSGLHTVMATYRLYYDHGLLKDTALAGLGFDEIRFRAPLKPNDTIQAVITIIEKRLTTRPGRGLARLKIETVNQNSELILSMILLPLVACRRDGELGA
jgi:acyl dehydratase